MNLMVSILSGEDHRRKERASWLIQTLGVVTRLDSALSF